MTDSLTESRYRATPARDDEPILHEIEVEIEDVGGWRLRAWYAGGHEVELYAAPTASGEAADGPSERQIAQELASDVLGELHADQRSADVQYYQALVPHLLTWAQAKAASLGGAEISELYDRA